MISYPTKQRICMVGLIAIIWALYWLSELILPSVITGFLIIGIVMPDHEPECPDMSEYR